jgi:colanic acid biosynthesis glycosyl transferase WcaI
MRILIHGINYAPELIGIGKYTGELAEWLAEHGHEVRVVTTPPYYPSWKIDKNYSGWRYRREMLRNVDVWRCPLFVPAKPSGLKRLLHLVSFTISSFPVMLLQALWRADMVIVIEPSFFCAPQALLTAWLSKSKTWLHIQDFEVEAFFGLGFSSLNFIKKLIVATEGWLMRRLDHVSSISSTMVNRVTRLKVPQSRISLFPNWVDTQYINPNSSVKSLRSEWSFSEEQKIVLYSGNMGKKQGLEMVLDAAAMLEKTHKDVSFIFVGEGVAKSELIEKAQKLNLENTLFKPLQPIEKLSSLLAMADIHLLIQKRGIADAVMPSKLTAILASGGHAVVTADEDTELGRLVLNNHGIATLVQPENTELFAKTITELLAMPEIKRGSNLVARTYAERYLDKEVILCSFEKELSDIVNNKNRLDRMRTT